MGSPFYRGEFWVVRFTTRPFRVAALALVLTLYGGTAAPAVADDDAPVLADSLEASLWFDRDTYQPGDEVRLTIVLSNRGERALTGVTATCRSGTEGPYLGGGWGGLAEGGPGLSLAPGATTLIDVSEPVPPAAPRFGYVGASCDFGAQGYPRDDVIPAGVTARLPGDPAGGGGTIYEDRNGNGRPDAGEGVAGVPVVILDRSTWEVVARASTDERGGFTVADVPAGRYDLRVIGPWRPRNPPGWFEFQVVAGSAATTDHAVVPTPEPVPRTPRLAASAAFDKPHYTSGDVVRVRITVTNIGDAPAEGVLADSAGGLTGLETDQDSWGEFLSWGPGTRIEAGATREIEVVGTIGGPQLGVVTFHLTLGFTGETDFRDTEVRRIAAVTMTRGTYAGRLYGDRNGNGAFDPGEELGRTRITLDRAFNHPSYEQLTDLSGRFAFRDIPTGRYFPTYHLPPGWYVPHDDDGILIAEGSSEVELGAQRPISEHLTASIRFTKDTYAVGETAHLIVTLTNTSSRTLTGITTMCLSLGMGNEITNDTGWGELAEGAPELSIPAGATRTFEVTSQVPEGAFSLGHVVVGCTFGRPGLEGADADAEARVPGGIGTVGGLLLYDRDYHVLEDGPAEGEGVANTKVVLLDQRTGMVMGRSITDARGYFEFRDMPADKYEFRVVGPWRIVNSKDFFIFAGQNTDDSHVKVIPGPYQPDPDGPPAADPQPQGGPAPGVRAGPLALTGADVLQLAVAGVLALLAGLGLLLVRRRRPVR